METLRNNQIVITGMGMMTPVGHNAWQACASIRADMVRIEEIDILEYYPVFGCPVSGVTDGYIGKSRLKILASHAINDLMTNTQLTASDMKDARIYIAVPPLDRWGLDKNTADFIIHGLCKDNPLLKGMENQILLFPEGHAAGASAIKEAIKALNTDEIQYAIVGGVDSLVDIDTLLFYFKKERIKYHDNPYGFMPGEASAFILLEKQVHANSRKAEIISLIMSANVGTEIITIWSENPSIGTGLSEVIRKTFSDLSDNGIYTGSVICDLNGELYRAKEFSYAVPRILKNITTNWRLIHSASNLGDTGAASFIVSICTGARSLSRGYAKTDNILICGSSDDGLRGSVYLRKYLNQEV
jgi:3-oxoacyl-[acyl-carrier-protein] synthase-1